MYVYIYNCVVVVAVGIFFQYVLHTRPGGLNCMLNVNLTRIEKPRILDDYFETTSNLS